MLQRIYGTAWESDAALKEHLHRLEEAEKRDHRRLAAELDLISFPEELGGGLAVWHPKGATVRRLMEDYSRARHERGGYEFVFTPHLSKAQLFQTSGHLDWYADGMYPPMEMDNGVYYPKPMNCPMHCLIFRARQRSYRELPLRLFELGTVYRYERAGVLHGLLRTRGFTQDDSHIFCTAEQLDDELHSLLEFVLSVLRAFGFEEFQAYLSTRDPEKSIGSDEMWERATASLRAALEREGMDYKVKEGDAAFYGPKIDIDVRDAIGRMWQLSTIQLDFNHPERFELEYVGADNARHRPIMVHRALFGSIERFFGVLVEHFAGAFPTWMAPLQVRVLPVSDGHDAYAQRIADRLHAGGYRVDVVEAVGSARQADPRRQAGEDPLRAGGRRRRRARRHGRRQPARRRGGAGRVGRRLRSAPRRRRRPRLAVSSLSDSTTCGPAGARRTSSRPPPRRRAAGRRSPPSSRAGCPTPRRTSCGGAGGASPSSTPSRTRTGTCW